MLHDNYIEIIFVTSCLVVLLCCPFLFFNFYSRVNLWKEPQIYHCRSFSSQITIIIVRYTAIRGVAHLSISE